MKAARLHAYGDADQFSYDDVADPVAGAGQVLIRVAASSLNPFETYVRKGFLAKMIPLQLPAILGIDVAGTVAATGPGVTAFAVGDRVAGMLPVNGAGSNAELVVADTVLLARVPDALDLVAAAAYPAAGYTGYQVVTNTIRPAAGQRILVTGALGAVGRTAIFALKRLGAVPVAGIRAGREAEAAALGVEAFVLDGPAPAQKFDGAINNVRGDAALVLFRLIKDGGTIAAVAGLPDTAPKDSPVKVAGVQGTSRPADLDLLLAAAAKGDFTLPIAKRFPLSQIAEGHRLFDAGHVGGKIVFTA